MHTPGPWTLETVRTQVGICHKIGPFPWKEDRDNHACIYVDYPGRGPIEDELLANARLIAAAPSLLEACQAAVESANVNEDTVYTMHDKGREAYEKLKAAIAAATDVHVSETGAK